MNIVSKTPRSRFWIIGNILAGLLPILLGNLYWLNAYRQQVVGFPLDDAWIHQTYARNLALNGKWMFQAGGGPGGSTSPLWTLFLVPGHWLGNQDPIIYSNVLSVLLFGFLVWIGVRHIRLLTGNQKLSVILGTLALSTCWQLNWAANSGMETILYSLMVVLVFYFTSTLMHRNALWTGLLIGLAVWVRPDAITLLAPVALIYLIRWLQKDRSLKPLFLLGAGAVLPVSGYCIWNVLNNGAVFPNTFFAKQAEYAELLSDPLFFRFANVITPVLTGAVVILIPGIIYSAVNSIKKRDFLAFSVLLWCLGYAGMYALRLPVSYQHGRYLMPIVAPLIILGVSGLIQINDQIVHNFVRRVILPAWMISLILVSGVFWFKGLGTYGEDVNAINHLMVNSALWIRENAPSDATIAVHDIGAMGYFSEHKIIDLAGLINPEVIPFMRNEGKLANYLTEQNANYLVILKNWYPALERMDGKEIISFTAESGGEIGTMLIYKWN